MKFAVFSDVHSNIEALDAVLNCISEEKADECIFCGDIVGYGPNPNECVQAIKKLKNLKIVAGNHDKAAVGLIDTTWFNPHARSTMSWTKSVLTDESRDFLKSLPDKIVEDKFTIVHGSPRDPINEYLTELKDIIQNMDLFKTQICFVGHSHRPFIYDALSGINQLPKEIKRLSSKTLVNIGSVGQPRDGNTGACYIILEEGNIRFCRVNYDIKKVQDKMIKNLFPKQLITRLAEGR